MRTPRFSTLLRWLAFLVFTLTASQILPWAWCSLLPSALSPLSGFLGAVSARRITAGLFLGWPILILALLRGRWFCNHLCPMGRLTELAGRLNPRRSRTFLSLPHIGRWMALLCIGGALAGYPLFLWMDPLAIFSSGLGIWHASISMASRVSSLGFFLVLLVSVLIPQAWCFRLCPLGAVQDLLGVSGKRLRGHRHAHGHALLETSPSHPALTRRAFLIIAAGSAVGWLMRRTTGIRGLLPIRPPGAVDESLFNGLCARCGNCVSACPMGIIIPDLGHSGPTGLLTPVLDLDKNYCDEWCNACNTVCPSGAIRRLDLDTKRNTAIGRAAIDKTRCIAWSNGQHCMVCQEFCPYLAIRIIEHGGVNCPEVDAEQCRGCGACQSNCPAIPQKAILVQSQPQHPVHPMEADV